MRFFKGVLEFISFNNSEVHNEFIDELAKDKDVKKYLKGLKSKIKKINTNSMYQNGYIVRDIQKDELIGYLYLDKPYEKEMDISYAVHPDYRLEGYGRMILKSSSDFILEKDKSIENIALIINPDNYASKRVAESVGFVQEGNIKYSRKR